MTTMHHDDAASTAVEDALRAVEEAQDAARTRRSRAHLAAVDVATRTDERDGTGPASRADAPDVPATTQRDTRRAHAHDARSGPRLRLVPAPGAATATAPTRLAAPPTLGERVARLGTPTHAVVGVDDEPATPPLTDPGRFAHGVGLACVEVVLGRRAPAQLARWVSPAVLESLHDRADLVRRAGVLAHARRPAARRVRVCPVGPRTVEACLVIDDGVRVRAVALRLEAHRGAWRVTTLEIG